MNTCVNHEHMEELTTICGKIRNIYIQEVNDQIAKRIRNHGIPFQDGIWLELEDYNRKETYVRIERWNKRYIFNSKKADVFTCECDETNTVVSEPIISVFEDEGAIHWLFVNIGRGAPFKETETHPCILDLDEVFGELIKRMWHLMRGFKEMRYEYNKEND